jgi:hypothetical protein
MESIESGGYPSPYVSAPLFPLGGSTLGNPFVPNWQRELVSYDVNNKRK